MYGEYYAKCQKCLELPEGQAARDYLEKHGISLETAKKAGIGFDVKANPIYDPGGISGMFWMLGSPSLVVPISEKFYQAVSIDERISSRFRILNVKGSKVEIFNKSFVKNSEKDILFVVEEILDALTLMEIGVDAIAVNGCANVNLFFSELQYIFYEKYFIIAFNNNLASKKVSAKLYERLDKIGIVNILVDLCDGEKNINKAFLKNKTLFLEKVNKAFVDLTFPTDESGGFSVQ